MLLASFHVAKSNFQELSVRWLRLGNGGLRSQENQLLCSLLMFSKFPSKIAVNWSFWGVAMLQGPPGFQMNSSQLRCLSFWYALLEGDLCQIPIRFKHISTLAWIRRMHLDSTGVCIGCIPIQFWPGAFCKRAFANQFLPDTVFILVGGFKLTPKCIGCKHVRYHHFQYFYGELVGSL